MKPHVMCENFRHHESIYNICVYLQIWLRLRIFIYMKYEIYIYICIYKYTHIRPLSKLQIWVCCHFAATWFNVYLCVSSCNWLKLESTAQLTHADKVFGMFWGNRYMHFFCQAILLSYRTRKKPSSSDLTNTGTQHAANMSMRGVSRM